MRLFRSKKPEERATVTQSSERFFEVLGLSPSGGTGQIVNVKTALGVPAVFAAVNFISGTIAGLPLHVYRRDGEGRERVSDGVAALLHDAPSDEMTSYAWRQYTVTRILTGGRGLTQIVRNGRGQVVELVPMEPSSTTVRRVGGKKFYDYDIDGKKVRYPARDVIDLPFMLDEDGLSHISPISANRVAIGRAQAVQEYASRFFDNGGVPPFAVTGNFQSGKALNRASDDLHDAVKRAAKEGRQALTLPSGLEIKTIGADPEKTQLLETQRFCVEEIARIYSLPPTFLQDLTHGTYSNTEQQDLHFAKHTLKRWVEQFEQELNLKLFGRGSEYFVEFSMDGLLRGDFKTRMDGYAQGIQNGVMTPNEARRMENRPEMDAGGKLMIQGATVPIENQLQEPSNEV
jgi:HK97 family phage portal protein